MTENLVSILIPTRGRARLLKKHIGLIRKNTFYMPYELFIMVDEDDKATRRVCDEAEVRHFTHPVLEETRDFYVAKINRGFRESDAEYLVYFSDDVAVGRAWLMHALKCFDAHFPDGIGLVAFNDGNWKEKLAPHGLVSRKWIDEYQFGGWLLWPEYLHYHGDNEITRVARRLNKFAYCPDSKAVHTRPKDPKRRDAIWREMNEYCWPMDTEIFQQRIRQGFPGYGSEKTETP